MEGFIHLQQYHAAEITRGLSGLGCYRLRQGFPACDAVPQCNTFSVQPDEIVSTLQHPTAEVQKAFSDYYKAELKLMLNLFI